jgi:hypothetical protein
MLCIGNQQYEYGTIYQAIMRSGSLATKSGPLQEKFRELYRVLDRSLQEKSDVFSSRHIDEIANLFRGHMNNVADPLIRNILTTIIGESDRKNTENKQRHLL